MSRIAGCERELVQAAQTQAPMLPARTSTGHGGVASGRRWSLFGRPRLPTALCAVVLAAGAATAAHAAVTGTTATYQIVIAKDDGTGRRVLTHGGASSISPDGALVAVADFTARRNGTFTNFRTKILPAAGGQATQTYRVACGQFAWAPDSSKFACSTYDPTGRNPRQRLLLFDAATGAQIVLATGFFSSRLSFSPDSTQLAFVQYPTSVTYLGGALKLVELGSRMTTVLRSRGAASPAWGPTALAFAVITGTSRNPRYEVALIQPDGTGFRQLTNFRETRDFFGPEPVAWSADGSRLLGGMVGRDAWTHRLSYAIDLSRGSLRKIANIAPSAISRDGRFIIGATGDASTTGVPRSNIVRVPWAGGRQRVLIRGSINASFNG